MKYLIDTHTFIWYLENNPFLSAKAKTIIENEQNHICLSIASLCQQKRISHLQTWIANNY